jgi:hypothetical protein
MSSSYRQGAGLIPATFLSFDYIPPNMRPPELQLSRRDSWQDEETQPGRSPKRPEISTTQILIAILAIALVSLVAYLWSSSRTGGMEAAILSPDNGDRLPAGRVIIRARADGGERGADGRGSGWEVAYSAPSAPNEWQTIASGPQSLIPALQGRGMFLLDLTEPGPYRVRVVYHDGTDRVVEDTVEFTIVS